MLEKYVPEQTVIVTGYTLEDFLAYVNEIGLLTNYTYQVDRINDPVKKNRMLAHLHKIKVKEQLPNGFTIIRPLADILPIWVNEYVKENEIPVLNTPCKNSYNKFKRLYSKTMSITKTDMSYNDMICFLEKNGVKLPETFEYLENLNFFSDC